MNTFLESTYYNPFALSAYYDHADSYMIDSYHNEIIVFILLLYMVTMLVCNSSWNLAQMAKGFSSNSTLS